MARHLGNVVDATVATVICDGVMNAHSAGIGGGAFFVYYDRYTKSILHWLFSQKGSKVAGADTSYRQRSERQTLCSPLDCLTSTDHNFVICYHTSFVKNIMCN